MNKVVRMGAGFAPDRTEYETEVSNIREIARIYGRADDSLELYNEAGELIAQAIWPQGSNHYKYSVGKDMNPDPRLRIFRA